MPDKKPEALSEERLALWLSRSERRAPDKNFQVNYNAWNDARALAHALQTANECTEKIERELARYQQYHAPWGKYGVVDMADRRQKGQVIRENLERELSALREKVGQVEPILQRAVDGLLTWDEMVDMIREHLFPEPESRDSDMSQEHNEMPVTLGAAAFNCTHPMGLDSCPIHSVNPEAPLMDCRYNAPMLMTAEGAIRIGAFGRGGGKVGEPLSDSPEIASGQEPIPQVEARAIIDALGGIEGIMELHKIGENLNQEPSLPRPPLLGKDPNLRNDSAPRCSKCDGELCAQQVRPEDGDEICETHPGASQYQRHHKDGTPANDGCCKVCWNCKGKLTMYDGRLCHAEDPLYLSPASVPGQDNACQRRRCARCKNGRLSGGWPCSDCQGKGWLPPVEDNGTPERAEA